MVIFNWRTFNQPLWRKIFHTLLNIPSCEELPDLSVLRRECEEYFISTLLAKYNKQINKVNIKLDSMSKKWRIRVLFSDQRCCYSEKLGKVTYPVPVQILMVNKTETQSACIVLNT